MTFHDRLKTLIQREGNIYEFEEKLGFSRQSISGAIQNKRSITSDRLELMFAAYPNWNASWLFTGKGEMYLDSNVSPLLEDLHARVKIIEQHLAQKLLIENG